MQITESRAVLIKDGPLSGPMRSQTFRAFVLLSATVWIAHFFYFDRLGLYEDDYALVSPALGWQVSDLANEARKAFIEWPQGRPLAFSLPLLLSFVGEHLGGLHVIHLIAFQIVALNAFLFYLVMRRVASDSASLLGALSFCLFPADSTHMLLVHAFHLQTSLTFLLLATICYLSEKRLLSYLIASGSLLAYESPFMVFMVVPLLRHSWGRPMARELARHLAIVAAMVMIVLAIRVSVGEERVAEVGANPLIVSMRVAVATIIGPLVAMSMFVHGPLYTIVNLHERLAIVILLTVPVFFYTLRRLFTDGGTIERQRLKRLLIVGALMLGAAYLVSFTHFPPTERFGRLTSVHLAAAFGASLIFGCGSAYGVSLVSSLRWKTPVIAALAVYLSLLVAYRHHIQLDLVRAWNDQRTFWSQATSIAPDLADGTVMFVLDHDLSRARFIQINSWADPIILSQLFQFPSEWKNPPRLFVVPGNWTESLVSDGEQFTWEVPGATWLSHWEVLPNANVILLEKEAGRLVRRFGDIAIGDRTLTLKAMPQGPIGALGRGPLYDYLLGSP